MAENSHSEKEYASTDQVDAAHVTKTSEPVATEPLKYVESTSGDSGRSRSGSDSEEKKTRLAAHRTTTQATTTSTFTTESRSTVQPKEKKPWYRNLNPLKWGKEPPVPKERIVSREYGANFFSMLTFQWMAPLMAVRYLCITALRAHAKIGLRLDTNVHWN